MARLGVLMHSLTKIGVDSFIKVLVHVRDHFSIKSFVKMFSNPLEISFWFQRVDLEIRAVMHLI